MKIFIGLMLIASFSWGRSTLPSRVVTPPLDLFDPSNKTLPNGDVEVKVTTYSKRGDFIHHGSKLLIPKAEYEKMLRPASAVFEMIPNRLEPDAQTGGEGTAFSIGENLVLTNAHVLDPGFKNTTQCSSFEVVDSNRETFECKKVHYCNTKHDVCLIEMAPIIKRKRNCTFCSGTKYQISLADGPSLKLKAKYTPKPENSETEVLTAIGNSHAFGIHYAEGRGFRLYNGFLNFYAPITTGNSGGPLLNEEGLVVGIVKIQSSVHIGEDPGLTYNRALPTEIAIQLIREGLRDDPETLTKFNQSVVE